MVEIPCPRCNNSNPADADICHFCGAQLTQPYGELIHPGVEPINKFSPDLDGVSVPEGKTPIHPGEAPIKETGQTTSPMDSTPPEAVPGELPDWLARLKPEREESEEIPDWLAGIRNKIEKPDSEQPPEELPSEPQAELLSHSGEPAEDAGAQPAGLHGPGSGDGFTVSAESSEPEWLDRSEEETSQPESSPGTAPAETPDWSRGIPAEPSVPVDESASSSIPSEIPDWLTLPQTEATPSTEKSTTKPFKIGSIPSAGEEQLDWLSKLQAEAEQVIPALPLQPVSEPMKDETPAEPIPAWLSEIKETDSQSEGPPALVQDRAVAESQGQTAGLFPMEEQPDWLSTVKPEESEKATIPESDEEQLPDSLEKAELPSWVQAMRPVEAVVADLKLTPANKDQPVEQVGPLAGLRGVLPAVSGLGLLHKPPAYSIKLQVGDSQQQHAVRLERIITNETESRAIRSQARLYPERILRWIIALVLFLIIGGTVATDGQILPASALYPPEMIGAMDVIGGLGTNSPVLVVFDYQPALSGEMEAAAAPMIDSLLFKGALLTFLSTSPTGPALAERFMVNTQAGHNYQAGQQYINLGYLPGGPSGMLDFAQNPAVASPYSVDGQSAWQMPPLQGIQQFSDFAAVIILIDDPDTGRTWIEQTWTLLNQTPMLMVISAQAEPMIRPYYDSGQIKGLVTGLAGGKAYENAIQRPGLGEAYWNAFSIGMLAAEIMIILGAVWSILAAWRNRRTVKVGEA